MINKFKNIIIVFLIFIPILFASIKYLNVNKSNNSIENIKIFDYIPSEYDFTLVSNYKNSIIDNLEKQNIQKKELNIIKDSIFSYLGFDLQKKIKDIYDGQFALSIIDNYGSKDIVFIFKVRSKTDINNVFNIGKEFNEINQIIKLERPDKLNLISYIYQTKDNYIITSSSKNQIENSLNGLRNNNKNLFRNLFKENDLIKEANLISISQNNLISDKEKNIKNILISIYELENNNIKIRSFTSGSDPSALSNLNNQLVNIKEIIFTNKLNKYIDKLNFLFNNIIQKDLIEELSKKISNPIFILKENNNWIFSFSNKLQTNINLDKLNSLQNFNHKVYDNDNVSYSIYTKDRLEIENSKIIYEKEGPIFTYKDEDKTYISNNFQEILNIDKLQKISDLYVKSKDDEIKDSFIINERLFINNLKKNQLKEYFYFLKYVNYFTNNEFLVSLKNTNLIIRQKIPERDEMIYLETNLRLF